MKQIPHNKTVYSSGQLLHPESRLTYVHDVETCGKSRQRKAMFLCECGNYTETRVGHVKSGRTRSCGCLNAELSSERETKHGESNSHLYSTWAGIRVRCGTDHPRYGGRGIKVCNEWKDDYESFKEWAIINGYDPSLQIDRIDNNGDYTPDNCRFVMQKINARNTSKSKWWYIKGKRFDSASQAAKAFNVTATTIGHWCRGYIKKKNGRIYKYGNRADCWSKLKYN